MEKSLRVLVIGGVACGPKAAARIKRLIPQSEVTMVDRGSIVSYGACGLPYYVEGTCTKIEALIETAAGIPRDAGYFKRVKGFDVLTRTEAIKIDRKNKTVLVRNVDTGKENTLPYDKLVVATGSRALQPPIPGRDLENVWYMRSLDDAKSMADKIEAKNLSRAVLIGAGYIGVEMAEALRERGLQVTMVEIFDQVMPQFLDPEISMLVAGHMSKKGVDLALGEKVMALEGSGSVSAVKTDKRTIPADLVVIGVGVRPNDELAKDAGLDCSPRGGILINEFCRTSDPDIYAGGDCVVNRYIDPAMPDPVYVPLGSTSNKHGRVIADHIAGRAASFSGITSTGICKAFEFNVGRTGLTEKQAREIYPDVETAIWAGADKPHYFPGSKTLIIKLVGLKSSRKIIGAQVVGQGDSSKRLDLAAGAIYFGATAEQVANIDHGYAPPYSPPIDPIAAGAHLLANKLDGIACSVSPLEAKKRIDSGGVVVLDVRTPREFNARRVAHQDVLNIPLDDLRERLGELPRDKDIFIYCGVSLRAYEAQLILNAAGFDRVFFIEGGLAAWPFKTASSKKP